MLIEKGVCEGDVVTIKLSSGEELIAKLIEEDTNYYTLSKPMVVVMTQKGPSLMKYLFTIGHENNIKLAKSSTATLIQATEKIFANQYIELTTDIKLI